MHTCKIEQIYCNIVCKTLEKPYKRKYCVAVESRIMWYYLIKKIKQDLKATSFTDKKKYSNCTEINFRFEWRKRKGSFSIKSTDTGEGRVYAAGSMTKLGWHSALRHDAHGQRGTMPRASEARRPHQHQTGHDSHSREAHLSCPHAHTLLVCHYGFKPSIFFGKKRRKNFQ